MILANRPVGIPEKNTWNYKEELIPEIQDGQILIKHQYISLDPAMRGWMNNSKSYIPPVEIGTVMRAGTVGEVINVKNNTNFKLVILFQAGVGCKSIQFLMEKTIIL